MITAAPSRNHTRSVILLMMHTWQLTAMGDDGRFLSMLGCCNLLVVRLHQSVCMEAVLAELGRINHARPQFEDMAPHHQCFILMCYGAQLGVCSGHRICTLHSGTHLNLPAHFGEGTTCTHGSREFTIL